MSQKENPRGIKGDCPACGTTNFIPEGTRIRKKDGYIGKCGECRVPLRLKEMPNPFIEVVAAGLGDAIVSGAGFGIGLTVATAAINRTKLGKGKRK